MAMGVLGDGSMVGTELDVGGVVMVVVVAGPALTSAGSQQPCQFAEPNRGWLSVGSRFATEMDGRGCVCNVYVYAVEWP